MGKKTITAFYDKHIKWIDGGTIRVGANNPVPVRLKSESVSIEWLEKILKELEKKEDYKIVLDSGFEFPKEKMSLEKREGVHLAIGFIRKRLSAAKKEAKK